MTYESKIATLWIFVIAVLVGGGFSFLETRARAQTVGGGNPVVFPPGTCREPGLHVFGDTRLGFYSDQNGNLRLCSQGQEVQAFTPSGLNTVGSLTQTIDGEDLWDFRIARGTLTAAQVRTLNATPVEVIAAPGAGLAITVSSAQFMLDWNANIYDSIGAGEDLSLIYDNGARAGVRDCDSSTNCINPASTADYFGIAKAGEQSAQWLRDNSEVSVTIRVGEWAVADNDANGDSPIHYLIRYRTVTLDLS